MFSSLPRALLTSLVSNPIIKCMLSCFAVARFRDSHRSIDREGENKLVNYRSRDSLSCLNYHDAYERECINLQLVVRGSRERKKQYLYTRWSKVKRVEIKEVKRNEIRSVRWAGKAVSTTFFMADANDMVACMRQRERCTHMTTGPRPLITNECSQQSSSFHSTSERASCLSFWLMLKLISLEAFFLPFCFDSFFLPLSPLVYLARHTQTVVIVFRRWREIKSSFI